ncbi:DUF935 domain-containing protein [Sulfuriflexus mobilis]|uniref:DUF935 domain-containing protein n=1 Tax=Sulfuriflexus mobilis TaxID=1811807 RepID=UPI000F82825E|nr:DUF935 domain-containing protein [Sulfuriflexus mobilis]
MPKDIRILGPNGKAIRKQDLTQEIATASLTGVRTVWGNGSIAEGINPSRLAAILRNAAEGNTNEFLTLAEEMEEREPHYGSVLATRKRAVTKLPVTVEAASDDAKDVELADAVRNQVRRPQFRKMKKALMDALGKGYSVVEIMWDRSGRQWQPKEFVWRDPRFFMFDRVTGRELRLLDEQDMMNGIPLGPYKFIKHVPQLKMGLPIRAGLARLVAVSYMCKSYTLTDWMAFAEVFGMPIRVGRHGPNATKDDIETLISAVANIGSDAAAVIPDSMKIEFIETAKASGGHELFQNLAEWLDKQTSKAVLGQTMTTDDGSSQSQANVHDEVREDIQEDDAHDLADTLNEGFVRPFIDLNYGPQESYPSIGINVPQPEDLKALSEALEILVPLGLRVEESGIRDKFSLADPAKGATLLQPQGQPVATETGANRSHAHCPTCATAMNRDTAPADEVDELADAAAEEWEPVINEVLDPVEAMAERVDSYEAFLAELPGLIEEMGADELVKRLALETFKARGVGDAE